jgi:hypothetical protein
VCGSVRIFVAVPEFDEREGKGGSEREERERGRERCGGWRRQINPVISGREKERGSGVGAAAADQSVDVEVQDGREELRGA